MAVHNHGTEDGPGLACRERLVDGQSVADGVPPFGAGRVRFEQRPPCRSGPYFDGAREHFDRCPHYGAPLGECVGWASCPGCAEAR